MEITITIKGVVKMNVDPDLFIYNIIVDIKEKKYSDAVGKETQKRKMILLRQMLLNVKAVKRDILIVFHANTFSQCYITYMLDHALIYGNPNGHGLTILYLLVMHLKNEEIS